MFPPAAASGSIIFAEKLTYTELCVRLWLPGEPGLNGKHATVTGYQSSRELVESRMNVWGKYLT